MKQPWRQSASGEQIFIYKYLDPITFGTNVENRALHLSGGMHLDQELHLLIWGQCEDPDDEYWIWANFTQLNKTIKKESK